MEHVPNEKYIQADTRGDRSEIKFTRGDMYIWEEEQEEQEDEDECTRRDAEDAT